MVAECPLNPILPGYYSLIACIDSSRLFLNIKNENFWQNLNLKILPQPPSEGGTKKMIFLKISRRAIVAEYHL